MLSLSFDRRRQMKPIDIIIIVALVVIVGSALLYIYKQKKSGVKCIGCAHSKACSSQSDDDQNPGCGCGCH